MPASQMLPHLASAPPWVQQGLERLCARLSADLGDALVSVVLYGGLAKGEFGLTSSDVNVLIVVQDDSLEVLQRAAPAVREVVASMPLAPLFTSAAALRRCSDLFPIKFQNMQRGYVLLWGRDVLVDLTIHQDHLRLRLEQELRNLELRLKQSYLLHGGRPDQLERILLRALSSLLNTMAAWVHLASGTLPATKAEVLQAAERITRVDLNAARTLLQIKYAPARDGRPEMQALFGGFLGAVSQLAGRAGQVGVQS